MSISKIKIDLEGNETITAINVQLKNIESNLDKLKVVIKEHQNLTREFIHNMRDEITRLETEFNEKIEELNAEMNKKYTKITYLFILYAIAVLVVVSFTAYRSH